MAYRRTYRILSSIDHPRSVNDRPGDLVPEFLNEHWNQCRPDLHDDFFFHAYRWFEDASNEESPTSTRNPKEKLSSELVVAVRPYGKNTIMVRHYGPEDADYFESLLKDKVEFRRTDGG